VTCTPLVLHLAQGHRAQVPLKDLAHQANLNMEPRTAMVSRSMPLLSQLMDKDMARVRVMQ